MIRSVRASGPRPAAWILAGAMLASGVVTLKAVAQAAAPVAWAGMSPLREALFEQAARQKLNFLPNQVIVKFKAGVARSAQQRALTALRSRPDVDAIAWTGSVGVITDLGQWNGRILAAQLREQPEVEYAQPNYLRHVHATPNDPDYGLRQWNFDAIDLPRGWDITTGAGVTIAIVDTGVTTFSGTVQTATWDGASIVSFPLPFAISPDFAPGRFTAPQDFINGFGGSVLDTDGHGTHVAGTAAEDTNNGIMLAGIAANAKIMPVKVCATFWDVQFARSAMGQPGFAPFDVGGCPDDANVPGIRWAADHGANVLNFSIGGPDEAPAEEDAIRYAVSHGVFVAISAGNDYDLLNEPQYPAKYAETLDGAMAVAALGRSLGHAYYSSSGSYVEIAAPGGDVTLGVGGEIWQASYRRADIDDTLLFPRFDRYEEVPLQGTSMASPHVAGTAALLASQLKTIATPQLLEQIIKKTARVCTATSCDATGAGTRARNDFFGAGLVQPRAALFGSGLRR